MTGRIVDGFDPVRIILFGSTARGDARPDSDVDLLVVLAQVENKRQAMVDILGSLADLPVATDVLVATPEEIERRGHLAGPLLRPALRTRGQGPLRTTLNRSLKRPSGCAMRGTISPRQESSLPTRSRGESRSVMHVFCRSKPARRRSSPSSWRLASIRHGFTI